MKVDGRPGEGARGTERGGGAKASCAESKKRQRGKMNMGEERKGELTGRKFR